MCVCPYDYIVGHKLYNDILICVLQYRFYGEPVVKAAVENGCHYLDVSGEPEVRFIQPNQFFMLNVLHSHVLTCKCTCISRSNTSNTKKCVSSDIQTLRSRLKNKAQPWAIGNMGCD